jgi:hypothetical protein
MTVKRLEEETDQFELIEWAEFIRMEHEAQKKAQQEAENRSRSRRR